MASRVGQQAPFAHGVPIVGSSALRDAIFPSAIDTDQRVHNKETGYIERWDGVQWLQEIHIGTVGPNIRAGALGTLFTGSTSDAANNFATLTAALNVLGSIVTSLATGTGTLVLDGAADIYLLQQFILPDNIVAKGQGERATIIKAHSSFPTSTPLVRLGKSTDTDLYHCRLEDIGIDCNGVTGSIGVYSTQVQEHSGLDGVWIGNFKDKGIHFTGTGCQNWTLDSLEVIPHSGAAVGWRGLLLDTNASVCSIPQMTVNSNGVANAGAAIELTGGTVLAGLAWHFEHMVDGLLLNAGQAYVNAIFGGAGMTNVVRRANVGGSAGFFGLIAKNGATNALNDQVSGKAFTSDLSGGVSLGTLEITSNLRVYGGQATSPTSAALWASGNGSNPVIEAQNSGARALGATDTLIKATSVNASDAGIAFKASPDVSSSTVGLDADASISAGYQALTYSATIATNASKGNFAKIAATNGTAFTISAPTALQTGQRLTYDILNSSGGAMGVITWNGIFLLAGAFTNPANTKRRTISFYYDGTSLIEMNRAAADI